MELVTNGSHQQSSMEAYHPKVLPFHPQQLAYTSSKQMHDPAWLQPQAATAIARRAPDEEVQALGADVAEGDGLWAPEAG